MSLFNKILLTLFIAMCITSPTWAAADMYLKISDINGESKSEIKSESRIVPCPGGRCVMDGFAAGNYELSVCDQAGKPLARRVVLYEEAEMESREAGSGLATGKRQHKPVLMTSEPGAAVRHFKLTIRNDAPLAIRIKDISAVKPDVSNQNPSRTNRLAQ